MPKPKTAPDLNPKPYRLLKTDLAAKLSPRSQGGITYLLLAEEGDEPDLRLAVTRNEGGGLWSREAISLKKIEAVLAAYGDEPFPTKVLRSAMAGKSANNPPFCLACLKDLGLVAPAADKAHQHVKVGDWGAFRAEWLAQPGEVVMYPPAALVGEPVLKVESPTAVQADEPEAANPGKGKQRKKAPADEVEGTVTGLDAEADPGEAEHAPTA